MKGTKTGGREAGTPNKVTKELRETLKAVISGELDRLAATLDTLPAKDRLDVILKLMPYCMPRIESIGGGYDKPLLSWD